MLNLDRNFILMSVSNEFAFAFFSGAFLFVGKSMYDLFKEKNLNQSEKVILALIISLGPIYGSGLFYFYKMNLYKPGRMIFN